MVKPLTILHTIETSGPGGAESVLLALATGLDPARFRSIVAINRPGWLEDRLSELRLPFCRLHSNARYGLKLPRELARLVKSEQVDLIHSHLPDQNFYASLAGRVTRCPTIVTYHGLVEFANARSWRGALKLAAVRAFASAAVAVCGRVGEMLLEAGFAPSKVVRIHNGIHSAKYARAEGALRRDLGVTPERPLIGMVANVRASKGHEFFIRAARMVADQQPEAFFVISGDLHPELAPPLFRLVEELRLTNHLKFIGFRQDVPALLSDLDIFVLPSTSEGFPLVVLEAMAASRPIVASNCGGVSEMIRNGETGLLVPIGNAEAIARQVSALLHDRRRAAALGAAAHREVSDHFSMEQMIARYEQLYGACAQARCTGGKGGEA